MGENIEVKDVQKTEYLDKNGLDMLWAKVKENTHNLVEIERNRAVAKENSITNSLSEFVSKTTTDVQYINSTLGVLGGNLISVINYTAGGDPVSLELSSTGLEFNGSDISTIELNSSSVNSYNGSRITIEAHNENPRIALQSNVGSDYAFLDNLTITNKGISNADNNANHVYATDGSIADLTQYALSSTLAALELKVTANTTTIEGKLDAGSYIPFDESDESNYKIKRPLKYEGHLGTFSFLGNNVFSISNTNKDFSLTDGGIKYRIGRMCVLLSPLGFFVTEDGNFDINISSTTILLGKTANPNVKINANGISLPNGDNNHVLTSHGSTIDITQYAKKSEITAGGNVDDVQVNGVTVVENKIANIKPATKESLGVVKVGDGLNVTDGTISVDTTAIGAGNYIPYKSIYQDEYYELSKGVIYLYDAEIGSGKVLIKSDIILSTNDDTTRILGGSVNFERGNESMYVTYDSVINSINGALYFMLNKNGLKLKDGDDNHVLTSNASTIDITEYAKKSVYDEKIAALEARIAALEAAA